MVGNSVPQGELMSGEPVDVVLTELEVYFYTDRDNASRIGMRWSLG